MFSHYCLRKAANFNKVLCLGRTENKIVWFYPTHRTESPSNTKVLSCAVIYLNSKRYASLLLLFYSNYYQCCTVTVMEFKGMERVKITWQSLHSKGFIQDFQLLSMFLMLAAGNSKVRYKRSRRGLGNEEMGGSLTYMKGSH